jgi:hypothetical protein
LVQLRVRCSLSLFCVGRDGCTLFVISGGPSELLVLSSDFLVASLLVGVELDLIGLSF